MSSEGSDKEFYQLVKDQQETSDAPLQFLCVEGKVLEAPDDICDGWSTNFGSLPTPLEMDQFDNGAKLNYLEDKEHIFHICRDSSTVIDPISTSEVQTALKNSNQTRQLTVWISPVNILPLAGPL